MLNKDGLIEAIRNTKEENIIICIAKSKVGDIEEIVEEANLNEWILRRDGVLELWNNTNYEL